MESKAGIATACLTLNILAALISQVEAQTRPPGDINYCQEDDFKAECPAGEVIVITEAKYGRMERGRCVKRNYGYLGCSMDVMAYVDSKCSGRRSCSFSVFENLRKYKPCPEDISSYLQAKYTCLKVTPGSRTECKRHHRVKASGSVGYIASLDTVDSNYGSADCPWRIEVNKGQRVNLTLYNFARGRQAEGSDADGAVGRSDVCYELAEIREEGSKRRMTLCDGLERHTSVYISRGNVIDVQLVSGGTLETLGYFLIKYQAIGCPDLKVPGGSWIKRDGDEATVKCNKTGQTRYLTCKGTQWIGEVGNCTSGILIVVAIGVALGIFFGGLLLSAVVFYMKRRQREPECAREMEEAGGEKLYMRYEVDVDKGYPRHTLHSEATMKGAPQTMVLPGVTCETLHHHHQMAEADKPVQKPQGGGTGTVGGGGSYSRGATLTRPGSGQYSRQHIYESPTFT